MANPLTIIIYSNDGKEVLWSNGWSDVTNCDVLVGYIPNGGTTYFQAAFILQGGDDNADIGGMVVYAYEGDGVFKGFSYEPNSAIVEIPEGEFLDWDNEDGTNIARLYVVDRTLPVRVYLGASENDEENEPIISIAPTQTGVIACENTIMDNDIYIRVPNQEMSDNVKVYLGDRLILEIEQGKTGVIACYDTIMQDDIHIIVPALTE